LAVLVLVGATAFAAAEPASHLATPVMKPLLSWALPDGEKGVIRWQDKDVPFAPQSFWYTGTEILVVNRFQPIIARYPVSGGAPTRVVPLHHEGDRKFQARFFTDVIDDGQGFTLLEQTTATIRKAGPDGTITAMHLLTEAGDANIGRLWPAGPQAFWTYDHTNRRFHRRDVSAAPDADHPAPGGERPLSARSLAAQGPRALFADREGEGEWALLSLAPDAMSASPTVLATMTALEVVVLDLDAAGHACVYVRDTASAAAFLRVTPTGDASAPPVITRLELPTPLAFPPDGSRIGQLIGPNRLLLLVQPTPQELTLMDVSLP